MGHILSLVDVSCVMRKYFNAGSVCVRGGGGRGCREWG